VAEEKGRAGWRIRIFGRETPALVGVVTRRKDLATIREQRWYRIPVRTAPEDLDKVQWLAFYQTAVFGPEKWAVNYYARVEGITTLPRCRLLPDEPNDRRARELYHRVALGELHALPRPIPSRRLRRIVFIPTSLERLLRAGEINDLYHMSPIEERLYLLLRDAGLEPERQYLVRESGAGHMLDMAVFCSDGNLDVECDGERWHSGPDKAAADRERDNSLTEAGWRILRFSGREINAEPDRCLRRIRRTVRRLGGPGPASGS
jgi:very-short-patch-repair endonuclease